MTMSPEDQLREIGIDQPPACMSAEELLTTMFSRIEIADDDMDVDLDIARHQNTLAHLRGWDQGEFLADLAYLRGLSNAMLERAARRLASPGGLGSVEAWLLLSLSPDDYEAVFGTWESWSRSAPPTNPPAAVDNSTPPATT